MSLRIGMQVKKVKSGKIKEIADERMHEKQMRDVKKNQIQKG